MSAVCIWFGFDLGLSCKLLWYKGSPALRKAVTTHVGKIRQFFTRVWSRGQSAETYHSPFSPLCHTDERTAKLSCTILKQTSFVGWVFLGLWLLKHWNIRIAYRQWRSKVSRRGRKPNYEEKNRVSSVSRGWEQKLTFGRYHEEKSHISPHPCIILYLLTEFIK